MQRGNAPTIEAIGWHLRPMQPRDSAAYIRLMAISPEAGLIAIQRLSQDDAYEKLMRDRSGQMVVVAETENGEVVGSGACDLRAVWFENQPVQAIHLHSLIIHPRYRRCGLTAALTRWRIGWARKHYGVNILIFAELPYGSTDAYNRASEWATGFDQLRESGLLRVSPHAPPEIPGLTIREATSNDTAQIVAGLNQFNQGINFTDYAAPDAVAPLHSFDARHGFVARQNERLVAGAVLALHDQPGEARSIHSPFVVRLIDSSIHLILGDTTTNSGRVENIWFAPDAAAAAYLLIETLRYVAHTHVDTLYFAITNPKVWDALHAPYWHPQTIYSIAYLRPRELKRIG